MNIALLGATGGIGRLVLDKALARGHQVTALARTPSKLDVQSPSLHISQGDALKPDDVQKVIGGQDLIISTIGARTLKPDTICEESARNVLSALAQTGVRRFICISGAGLGDNAGLIIEKIIRPLLLKNVYADALAQDALIKRSEIDWTIVRPYRLTNGPESSTYQVARNPFRSPILIRMTTRADVADFMVKEAEERQYLHSIAFISSKGI